MKMIRRYSITLLLILSFANIFAFNKFPEQNGDFDNNSFETATNQDSVLKNQMWEFKLVSTNSYTNPYKDVVLNVHFSNSDSSITFDSYGFWDGDSTFIIRSYFPSTGQWSWKTTCSNTSDVGLHNQSGIVSVREYNGTNKIYKYGGLKVSSNNKYLTYGDGTPFLWMGGTAWGLPMAATFEEWKTYIDDRHSKKFNIVQIAPARAHGGIWLDPPIIYPTNWKGDVCFFTDEKWNPLYWQELDRFIEYANSKEIVVVVVGLAEPVYDILTKEDAKLFTRNFSARVEGYHVILSPAFDTWQSYEYGTLDSTGEVLKNSRHLISQHTGHSYANAELNEHAKFFRDKSYLDFSMNQTGHNGGDLERCYKKAKQWNINLLNELPMKPVINTEVLYTAGTYAAQITDNEPERKGTDENARELGWLSLLSGSIGYTYGVQGIWNYGEQVDSSINLTIPLNDAINFVSSAQMEYLVNFFNTIAWWELEPNHSAIISSETDETKKMVFAISDSGKFGAAYLPDNNEIIIDMSVFSNKINASWFNPITGIFVSAEQNILNSGEHTFIPSTPGEWALLLQEKKEIIASIDYTKKWNLISIPLVTENMNITSIFLDSTSLVLKYDSAYTSIDTLSNGVGYWIKKSISGTINISGSETDKPINLKVGWNLIGAYNKEVKVDQIQTNPSGIISKNIYRFENGYHITDKLEVGKGYWIKANHSGEVSFSDTSLLGENSGEAIQFMEPLLNFSIIATDEVSDSISLSFGLDSLATNTIDSTFGEVELPPMPPPGVFDIRIKLQDTLFTSYSDIRFLAADCYEHEIQYQLTDSSDGLKLIWEIPEGVTLNIKDIIDGTLIDESFGSGSGSFKISNTDLNNIKLTFCYSEVVLSQNENFTIPNKFSLLQNYPNPFNPSTKIKFGLPKENFTSLFVYNILGEQVAVLLNKQLKAGYHEVEFNDFKHSSGIYFYRLQAGDFVEVKKMILLK